MSGEQKGLRPGVGSRRARGVGPEGDAEPTMPASVGADHDYHQWLTTLEARFVSELVPGEGPADRNRLRSMIEEPVRTEEGIARRVSAGGGEMERLCWCFGVGPAAQSCLCVLYRLERGGQVENVIRSLDAGGPLRVARTYLLRTTLDMEWSGRARVAPGQPGTGGDDEERPPESES